MPTRLVFKNNRIPLFKAATLTPLLLAAETIGTPVEKMLRDAKLPTSIKDTPHLILPEIPAWNLVNNIYQLEGDPLFGLNAATKLAPQDIETIRPLLKNCDNLKQLLERIVKIARTQSTVACYKLSETDDFVWFNYVTPHIVESYEQIELYDVAGMIKLVQLVAGPQWRPGWIHFSFSFNRHIYNAPELNPSKIVFSKLNAAIAIPRRLLALDISKLEINTNEIITSDILPNSLSKQLQLLMFQFMGEKKLDHRLLSDLTGMHFRTLQRKLAIESTTFSQVLSSTRLNKARYLLNETDEKLLNISLMLGYANTTAFSRAFKQWTGIAPAEFRLYFRINRGHFV